MKLKNIVAAAAVVACFASCKSYVSVPYFQDLNNLSSLPVVQSPNSVIKLSPGDKLNIVVSSTLSPEIASGFNLPLQSTRIGASSSTYNGNNSQSTMPYLIDSKGDIDFPILGKIRVAGMTREELEVSIKNTLVSQRLLNDAVVTCEVLNHFVNILGDVRSPGRIHIDKDNLNIIEAITMCGDLNITGERQTVMVIRREGDEQRVYQMDLSSAENVYSSEAFYLRPDDVVYVNPNDMKQRTSTPVGNTWQTPAIYFNLLSIALSLTTFVVTLSKK